MNKNPLILGLIDAGVNANIENAERTVRLTKEYPATKLMLIAIVDSLTWTGHALDDISYYYNALQYLENGEKENLTDAAKNAGRNGVESLTGILKGWKLILNSIDVNLITGSASAVDLINFQIELKRLFENLYKTKKISGIGYWILYSPLKIVISYCQELWKSDEINGLIMPGGTTVENGVVKLIKNNSIYTKKYSVDIFKAKNKGIDNAFLIDCIHNISLEICNDYQAKVFHVNSGLYSLGSNNILSK